MAFVTYYLRRVIGIALYALAYAALWPGLTYPMVSIQGNPAFWSNGKMGVGLTTSEAFLKPRTRSTIDLVFDLFDSRLYFPCGVIFFFSVVSPVVKLLVLLYGEIKGNIFRVRIDGYKESSMVDLRKSLRTMSKYQTVDVFVALITRELINSDFIKCDILDGFYYFLFYSFVSILASQVIDVHRDAPVSPPLERSSRLDRFLLFCSVSMFLVGLGWSLAFPILAVKFLFQSKIVIGETVASLTSFILPAITQPTASQFSLSSWIVFSTVVIVPVLVVVLSVLVQCCSCRALATLSNFLSAWSLIDVFAVALLTNLFAFASFSELRTSAPWGFYCVLMAAMSAHEVASRVLPVKAPTHEYEPVAVPMEEFNIADIENSSSSAEESSESGPFGPVSSPTRKRRTKRKNGYTQIDDSPAAVKPVVVVRSGGVLHVMLTITKRLGLPFFLLKALGWGIFFFVWFLNSGAGSLDLPSLSATLKANTPLVTAALQSSLPFGIGQCADLAATLKSTNTQCTDKGVHGLHYEKHTAYEILARWMAGFPSVQVTDMQISVPSEKKFLLSVSGQFSEIKLSLFIGQCLSSIFGSDDKGTPPVCAKLFDSVHRWTNVAWSIGVRADCFVKSPYVRNIIIDAVQVHSPMTVEEEIAFGLSIPLDDLAEHFRDGIKESIEPLLTKKEGWIPWGAKSFDLIALLSHLVELNVDSHGGSLQVACPKP